MHRLLQKRYGLEIHTLETLRATNKSRVYRLATNKGRFIAKQLFIPEQRQQFILAAEAHLRGRSVAIPATLPTISGSDYVMWRGFPLVLQRYIDAKAYFLSSNSNLARVAGLLGRMHAESVGFAPPSGETYNGARSWEQEYREDLAAIRRWQRRHQHSANPKIRAILRAIPFFLRAGELAQMRMNASPFFAEWKKRPVTQHGLVHGDFHMGNVLRGRGALTVIDWEDVRFDFPSKDLTRLFFVLMRRDGGWKLKRIRTLLASYLQKHPLKKEEKALLYQDLAFPHIFERFLRKKSYASMTAHRVHRFLRGERRKTAYMLRQMKRLGPI